MLLCVRVNPKCQSFFQENGVVGWSIPSTAVTNKNKFEKGNISSWEGYDDNKVSLPFLIPICIVQFHCHQFVYLFCYLYQMALYHFIGQEGEGGRGREGEGEGGDGGRQRQATRAVVRRRGGGVALK